MSAPPGPNQPDDAQLVAGVLVAFAAVYDRYGDRLYDFCYSLLRHREEAADAVADTFVLFAERLGQLRDPSRLRPWLYAIARSEGLRRLKARKRFASDGETELIAMADHTDGPEVAAEQAALRDLVWNAAAGLADRDRALLDLHLRQGLDGAELAEAMGVSAQHAYVLLHRLRTQVERSLGALLIARLGRQDCTELDGLLVDWDGRFSPLIRKRVARHVDACDVCSARRKRVASPWALLSTVALVPAPLYLRDRVVQETQLVAYTGPPPGGPGGGTVAGLTRTRLQVGAAVIAVLALGVALLWPNGPDDDLAADAVAAPSQTVPDLAPEGSLPASVPAVATPAPGSSAPQPSAPASPGSTSATLSGLAVSTLAVDLGPGGVGSSVELTNTGDGPLTWTVASNDPWLTVGPPDGRLGGRESVAVAVSADRAAVPEGAVRGSFQVGWTGGTVLIVVTMTEERAPQVAAPRAGAPGCAQSNVPAGRVPVTVAASDDTGLHSVTLTWVQPDGSAFTAELRARGAGWTGAAGPFPSPGTVTLQATATDVRGNSTTGPVTRIQVDPCPQ